MTKNRIIILAILISTLLSAGCSGPGAENIPYDPGTPMPAPHNGVFTCEYGSLTFNGNEESVITELDNSSGIFGDLPSGKLEGTYQFVSNLPPHGWLPVRYDTAHNLRLRMTKDGKQYELLWDLGFLAEDGKTFTIYIGAVTENEIPVVLSTDGGRKQALFKKQ